MTRSTGDTYPWAPGYIDERRTAPTSRPMIVTSRFRTRTRYTLDRYLATDGYQGLAKALQRAAADVHAEVRNATVLGRGGAGFPAGVKWGLTPQAVWPRYLVVNGDESEPGTYKDRLLMERDPHQLIEGCLIACYAAGLSQCFLYVRGEMALAQERVATALNEAYAAGYIGKNILGTDFSVDIVLTWGAGAYVVGEETALDREPRGQPRHAAAQAAVLPGGDRPVRPADDRQQRRDARQPAVAACANGAAAYTEDRHRDVAGHADGRGVRPRRAARCVRDRQRHHDVPRSALRRRVLPAGSATATSSRRSCPAVDRRRGSCPTSSTSRSRASSSAQPARCSAPGAVMVMDETTDIPVAAADARAASTPTSRAASACRAAKVARGSSGSWSASSTARAPTPTSTS